MTTSSPSMMLIEGDEQDLFELFDSHQQQSQEQQLGQFCSSFDHSLLTTTTDRLDHKEYHDHSTSPLWNENTPSNHMTWSCSETTCTGAGKIANNATTITGNHDSNACSCHEGSLMLKLDVNDFMTCYLLMKSSPDCSTSPMNMIPEFFIQKVQNSSATTTAMSFPTVMDDRTVQLNGDESSSFFFFHQNLQLITQNETNHLDLFSPPWIHLPIQHASTPVNMVSKNSSSRGQPNVENTTTTFTKPPKLCSSTSTRNPNHNPNRPQQQQPSSTTHGHNSSSFKTPPKPESMQFTFPSWTFHLLNTAASPDESNSSKRKAKPLSPLERNHSHEETKSSNNGKSTLRGKKGIKFKVQTFSPFHSL
ncbi:hypothetical protein FDP41_003472 [Naegleria fowleri]|uniref:Uncharacterized protein n=1 Tax=Naegleria fowleri TaxID=5763 RepID=A0A6A5BUQ3_NAEFO|nr:uncharacterized protein FDP41_003472 [Naegleria fowleri]KAF0977480.1 hypothetical protein FDP41_003472 [Naegleria fowleri]CAG4719479.1 unnamed protein product [Naegleria fowleri]